MSVSYKRTLSTGQLKCPNCGQDVIVADWKGEGNFDTTNLGIGGSFSWKCHWCKADGYLDFWAPWHELVMMDVHVEVVRLGDVLEQEARRQEDITQAQNRF